MIKPALGLLVALMLLCPYSGALVDLVAANPRPLAPFPSDPITTTPPTIFVSSPIVNQTYNSSVVPIDFIVIKPDSWYSNLPSKYAGYSIIRNITSIYYTVDGGERQNVTVNDAGSLNNPNTSPLQTLRFSLTLDLAAGQHSVGVGVDVESYYITSQLTTRSSSTTVNGSSEPIDFDVVLPAPATLAPQSTINTPTETLTPAFPVTAVVVAIAAVFGVSAGVGLLVYRKKSKLPKADQNP